MSKSILANDGSGAEDGTMVGAVYVFKKTSGNWQQQAYLKAPNSDDNDYFGMALDIFEDRIVVGAEGEDSDLTTTKGLFTDNANKTDSGSAYIFKRSGSLWSFESILKAPNSNPNHGFGSTVAIWGSSVLVGATGEASCSTSSAATADMDTNCANSGAVYAYQFDNLNNWNEAFYFKASNNNTMAAMAPSSTAFGESGLDLNGSTIAIGNYKEAGNTNTFWNSNLAAPNTGGVYFSGAVYIYFP